MDEEEERAALQLKIAAMYNQPPVVKCTCKEMVQASDIRDHPHQGSHWGYIKSWSERHWTERGEGLFVFNRYNCCDYVISANYLDGIPTPAPCTRAPPSVSYELVQAEQAHRQLIRLEEDALARLGK